MSVVAPATSSSSSAINNNLYRSNMLTNSNSSSNNALNLNESSLHLPKINHPNAKLDDPNSLNITARALSRTSSFGPDKHNYRLGNSYDLEDASFTRSKHFNNRHANDLSNSFNVPEGVRAIYTPDVNKISLPVFGGRPASSSTVLSFNGGRNSVANSMLAQKLDIEDYYYTLKEKLKGNNTETKRKFQSADQEGKGGISKEAFGHVLASMLGPSKPLSHQHFVKLLEKMGLKNRPLIRFDDFVGCLQDNRNETTEWIDPIRNGSSVFQAPSSRKATQVFVILKEKANLKTSDMNNLIPQLIGGSPSKIFKPELLSAISGMAIKMEPEEFDKLWKKFDPENTGFVSSNMFLKRLGLNINEDAVGFNSNSYNNLNSSSMDDDDFIAHIPQANDFLGLGTKPSNQYHVKNLSSRRSNKNPIEKWLKKRFREGFSKLKTTFEELDLQRTGQVRRDQFLTVLRQHGLQLEDNLLDSFLERCGIRLIKGSVLITYTDFLEKFQNRSDQGLAYRAIANGDINDDGVSTIGQVERRLIKLFQSDFLALLQIFRKIDRSKLNTISKQEFRAAIESHFSIELSDAEFDEFVKIIPKDSSNKIKYLEFMTRFDSDAASSLFDSQSLAAQDDYQPKKVRKYEPIIEENEETVSPRKLPNGRDINELNEIIKEKIKNHYKDVESAWSEVDTLNSNEMNKDMMWSFFKKLKIAPPIQREEIEALWNEFILKDNKKLEYWQFVRHFGYSKKSAAFTNSKRAPPKRGDNDMMLTSNKLGRDSILIRGSVQSKLNLQFDVLRRTFADIDPYGTNYLLRDEFEEVLRELCPELNKQEMEHICSKHENPKDGRVNYVEFLIPYTPRRNREKPNDSFKNEESLSSRFDINDTLTLKLRMKLTDYYKDLRRTFKKHDYQQTGFVKIKDFRDILKSNLNDDEISELIRRCDKDISGHINYNKFINEIIKP